MSPDISKNALVESSSSSTPDNHRKRRREKRAAAKDNRTSNVDGEPVASGSSSGTTKVGSTRRENVDNGDINGDSGTKCEAGKANPNATFEEGDEFIPFHFSENEGGDDQSGGIKELKGKADVQGGRDGEHSNEGRGKERDNRRDQRHGGDEPSHMLDVTQEKNGRCKLPSSSREWDQGKRKPDDDNDGRGNSGRNDRDRNKKRRHDDYDRDSGRPRHRFEVATKKCPWVDGPKLEQCQNVAEMMHCEVESFIDWISPSPIEDEIRGLIVAQITKVVKVSFADAEVYPFGSYQTKLYLPLGDIDLVVLSDSMAYSDKSTVLHVLANTLKRSGITSHVTIIAKAKVPIVKFVTTHGRFKVDISINQGNGLVSGKIITGFLQDMIPCGEGKESKALRSLVMVTKSFLSQRSMNEVYTGGLGSYSVVCLAVSFLQMHPKIRRGEIDPEKNLGVLVMEFFELYGHYFNYDEVGISLREGGTYFSKRQRGWHAGYKKNMLSIEDPADPSNDISSGSYNFHKVKTAFAGAHGILTATAYLRAGMLSSRHLGRSVNLRFHHEAEDLSILSTVMGITQETINHRRLVQELYDKRTLHDILGVKTKHSEVSGIQNSQTRESGPTTSYSDPKVVKPVWNGRDDLSDEDDHYRRHDMQDEERGRYDIGRQPPKKRRKTGRTEDAHTVYLIDDEDESRSERYENEDGEYYSDEGSPDDRRTSRSGPSPKTDNRRSYWLSKGIGTGSTVEGDSS